VLLSAAAGACNQAPPSALERLLQARRNSDVLSTALSLGQKGALTAKGDALLHALRDALDKRELGGNR
jgi:hypothetical protein